MRNKSILAYMLYLAIIIEIAFLIYFSITTKNIAQYNISLILITLIAFPLGISTSTLLFREKSLSELLTLGFCIGLPLTAGIWGLLTYCSHQIHPVRFLGTTVFLSILLLLVNKLKYKKIFPQKHFEIAEICLPLIVFLAGFIVHASMQANNNVSFDCDPQSTVYIETLMKYQGYPAIKPLIHSEIANITHPPTFHALVILMSIIKGSVVHKECMAIAVICGSCFVLAVYLLAYYLSERNYLVGFFAGILTLNKAYLTAYNDGNFSELFAFLSVAVFLIFLIHAFEQSDLLKSLMFALIGGFIFAQSALSQTEIFMWHVISFGFFALTFHIAKHVNYKRDVLIVFISVVVCAIVVFPWFLSATSNHGGNLSKDLFEKEATELILSLTYWHSYIFLVLSLFGIFIVVLNRNKIGIFVATYILTMFFLIIHWKFLSLIGFEWFQLKPIQGNRLGARAYFTTPVRFFWTYTIAWYSLSIAFPITAAYCINFIYTILTEKIFVKLYVFKRFNVVLSLIVLGNSFFIYYEYKNYIRYPEWLLESDYEALAWFRENTTYDNTLILNSPEPLILPNGISFYGTNWVSAVSERRAVHARGVGGDHIPIPSYLKDEIKKLGDAFYNIQSSGVQEMLEKNGITHIFVSAIVSGQLIEIYSKIPFLELVHYKSITNHGTAFIFRVK